MLQSPGTASPYVAQAGGRFRAASMREVAPARTPPLSRGDGDEGSKPHAHAVQMPPRAARMVSLAARGRRLFCIALERRQDTGAWLALPLWGPSKAGTVHAPQPGLCSSGTDLLHSLANANAPPGRWRHLPPRAAASSEHPQANLVLVPLGQPSPLVPWSPPASPRPGLLSPSHKVLAAFLQGHRRSDVKLLWLC